MSPYYVLETTLCTSELFFQHLHFSDEETETFPQSFSKAVTQQARGKAWPLLYLPPVVPWCHLKATPKLSPRAGLDQPQPACLILCKLQWQSEYSPLTIDTAKLISGPPTPRPLLLRVFTGLLTAATEMPTCISHH